LIKKISIVFFGLLLVACSTSVPKSSLPVAVPSPPPVISLVHSADVNQFIQQMALHYHFDPNSLRALLSQASVVPSLVNAMQHPNERSLSWYQYQSLFIGPKTIQGGQNFSRVHRQMLQLAERRYGVSPAIIVAILGVETVYGLNEGHVSALNSLYTLAFAYPRRETYFQNELAQFLVLTRDADFDPVSVKSSYAGALGMPQFMPSTYRTYAVSAGPYYPDLFSNPNDVILSVGHYFAKMGWQSGQPVALPAMGVQGKAIADGLLNQTLSLQEFAQAGVIPVNAQYVQKNPQLQAKLLGLTGKNGLEYWFVFHNFQVIKRYNSSNLYAMAVFQLSQLVSNS
jgi:membrane-bound lytic murein transglycosylase B